MSALEALAAGRAVLHSELVPLCEVIGSHGWIAEHDDPEVLADALIGALSAPPRRVPVDAVERYQWPAVVEQYRALYASMTSADDAGR